MKSTLAFIMGFAVILSANSFAENGTVSLDIAGTASLPLADDALYFGPGFGGAVGMAAGIGESPFSAEGGLSYSYVPLSNDINISMSTLALDAGAAFSLLDAGPFGVTLDGKGGGCFATLSDGSASDFVPLVSGGMRLSWSFSSLAPFLKASYTNKLGLSQEVTVAGGLRYGFAKAKPSREEEPRLELMQIKKGSAGMTVSRLSVDPIFPVFYTYYDSNRLGSISVRNDGKSTIESVEAGFLVKQYMDDQKVTQGPVTLAPGESAEIPLFALFTDEILRISEGSKASGSITVGYTVKDKEYTIDIPATIQFYDRNSMSWIDDRRAAAFVTAKDPLVLKFSKNLGGLIDSTRVYYLPKNFTAALGVFQSLKQYGLKYVVDPNNSYESVSKNQTAVDFIQFPRQTLDYKAGDCDDLSVLTAALLESLGARAAFITVPGHIYVAVDLDIKPDEARQRFSADMLIFANDKSWLPFEVTGLSGNFLDAWNLGAQEWRTAARNGEGALYPVAEAWSLYPPVGFTTESAQAQPPDAKALDSICVAEVEQYLEKQMAPVITKINADMAKEGRTPKLLNKLGVTYGKAGLRDDALAAFREATAKEDYASALINLGNIHFQKKDFTSALVYYERALKKAPTDPNALLAAARINHELENYGVASKYYTELKQTDTALAERFAYLDLRGEESVRAADASGTKEVVVWSE